MDYVFFHGCQAVPFPELPSHKARINNSKANNQVLKKNWKLFVTLLRKFFKYLLNLQRQRWWHQLGASWTAKGLSHLVTFHSFSSDVSVAFTFNLITILNQLRTVESRKVKSLVECYKTTAAIGTRTDYSAEVWVIIGLGNRYQICTPSGWIFSETFKVSHT